jgi:membrane-bound lytic murein transglycosylase D
MKRIFFPVLIAALAWAGAPDAAASEPVAAGPVPATVVSSIAPEVLAGATGAYVPPAPSPAVEEGDEPPADAPDDAAIDEKIQEESAALRDVAEAEESAHLGGELAPGDEAAAAAAQLGYESPLRLRLGDAFRREAGAAPDEGEPIPGLPEIDHDLRRLQAEYDIPIDVNEKVIAYVRFFQNPRMRPHFVRWLSRSHRYIPRYREILREEGLPEDTVYLAMIESGFANLAASKAKAVGPWQFIGATGRRFGLDQDFWLDERRDPEKAARAAARYLKELHGQTGDWRLAWAGYNAGVGKIYKARRKGQQDFWEMTRGRVLKNETKGYVPKLMAAAIVAKHAEAFGFGRDEVVPEAWTDYEEVVVERATELSFLAEAAEVPEKALLDLNPELRRTCTPPRPYALKIPRGQREVFARNWPSLSERAARTGIARHKVIKGETLTAIASAYGVAPTTIARVNGLKPGRRVKPGTVVVVPLGALARRDAEALAARAPKWKEPAPERAKAPKVRGKAARRTLVASASPTREERAATTEKVRVRPGDTLTSIARRFGVRIEELARWNGIRDARRHKLQAGRQLVVKPRASAGPTPRPGPVARAP